MSVVPVSAATAPAEPAAPSIPPASGFAAALATAQTAARPGDAVTGSSPTAVRPQLDPSRLRSVTLGQMVQALAETPGLAGPLDRLGALTPADPVRAAGAPTSASSSAILAAGERYLGVPYTWGGTDPAVGFDCSGFVQRVFGDLGISLPRVSVDQAKAGTAVASLDQARPGDLVFWYADGKRPNHIGIYAGDGQMLVAPRTGDVVRYQQISRTPHEIRRVT